VVAAAQTDPLPIVADALTHQVLNSHIFAPGSLTGV
jgi:hypothetical protein